MVVMNKLENFRRNLSPTHFNINKDVLSAAQNVLESSDFPTTKNEKWKYSRLGRLSKLELQQSRKPSVSSNSQLICDNAITIEINNGHIQSIPTLPKGIEIKSFNNCSNEELSRIGNYLNLENEVFHSLNSLYANDGIYIETDKNVKIDKEIHLLHNTLGNNEFIPFRVFIHCHSSSELQIVELFQTNNTDHSFVNPVIEATIEQNARLSITKVQIEDGNNFHIGSDFITQKKDSYYKCNTISLKGQFIRNNIHVKVAGSNCETHLNGAYLMEGNQHIDNQTMIDHLTPNCESHELYKGILDEKATAVFNGKVIVHEDAQKINAYQSNANVLLSDDANVNSKPELEIYADDVKCSHGSTTGQLDEKAIYYLRSRGISKRKAQTIVSQAFIRDVFLKIDSEKTKEFIHQKLKYLHNWELLS